MKVGVPKEIKNHEYRVAITPAGVHELVMNGHEVSSRPLLVLAHPSPTKSSSRQAPRSRGCARRCTSTPAS